MHTQTHAHTHTHTVVIGGGALRTQILGYPDVPDDFKVNYGKLVLDGEERMGALHGGCMGRMGCMSAQHGQAIPITMSASFQHGTSMS